MVVTMIPYPRDRISRKHHGGAGCEDKFEPFWHFKPAMGQVTMQIKRRANSAPKKEHKHNRQIGDMEARQESDESEQLQGDQDNEKEEIESFVLKHAAERARTKQPTGPQLNPNAWSVARQEGCDKSLFLNGGARSAPSRRF